MLNEVLEVVEVVFQLFEFPTIGIYSSFVCLNSLSVMWKRALPALEASLSTLSWRKDYDHRPLPKLFDYGLFPKPPGMNLPLLAQN